MYIHDKQLHSTVKYFQSEREDSVVEYLIAFSDE